MIGGVRKGGGDGGFRVGNTHTNAHCTGFHGFNAAAPWKKKSKARRGKDFQILACTGGPGRPWRLGGNTDTGYNFNTPNTDRERLRVTRQKPEDLPLR